MIFFINIPTDKKLTIVTDIHGEEDIFQEYLNLWNPYDKDDIIIFTGDLIHHTVKECDGSLEILDTVKEYIEYPNFFVLLGNHEHSQLYGEDVYKYGVNQCDLFRELVEDKYPNQYIVKYNEYKSLLSRFEYFATTSNSIFISHTGIHEDYLPSILKGDVDIYELSMDYDFERELITECLWSRPYDDYTSETIDCFLNYMGLKYSICGHTTYNPYHILGNQLILDNSIYDSKRYIQFNTSTEFNDIMELVDCIFKL